MKLALWFLLFLNAGSVFAGPFVCVDAAGKKSFSNAPCPNLPPRLGAIQVHPAGVAPLPVPVQRSSSWQDRMPSHLRNAECVVRDNSQLPYRSGTPQECALVRARMVDARRHGRTVR